MKKILISLLSLVLFTSCSCSLNPTPTPSTPNNTTQDDNTSETLKEISGEYLYGVEAWNMLILKMKLKISFNETTNTVKKITEISSEYDPSINNKISQWDDNKEQFFDEFIGLTLNQILNIDVSDYLDILAQNDDNEIAKNKFIDSLESIEVSIINEDTLQVIGVAIGAMQNAITTYQSNN